jgi:hypothetical protein
MYFQIVQLVLWPRKGGKPRVVPFHRNVVNVISGGSKTGKSAVIPIIDYCLGSNDCAIPVGKIRQACSWFGVVVDTGDGELLLARREPGAVRRQGDCFVLQDKKIDVPDVIALKNCTLDEVKDLLNRLSGLSNLALDAESAEGEKPPGFNARVGFRDLMAFLFQPQNIVANPDVLFFKADTTEHREKLKNVLPYVLGAETSRTLAARQDLSQVLKQLKRLSTDLRHIESTAARWAAEGRSWLQQAMELGLTPVRAVPNEWRDILAQLREAAGSTAPLRGPSVSGIDSTIDRMAVLQAEVRRLSTDAGEHKQRLAEIRHLNQSAQRFGGALELQRERLALSTWIRERLDDQETPLERRAADAMMVERLCGTLETIELQVRTQPVVRGSLDKEETDRRQALSIVLEALTGARKELAAYERESDAARAIGARHAFAERFLGRLEQALNQYDDADRTGPLKDDIKALSAREIELRAEIDAGAIRRKQDLALNEIQTLTDALVPQLDGEWKAAPIRLNVQELTIEVTREGRQHFLWEIGSGANWLAYHIAITVALQQFFGSRDHNPVPGLLIYDQPSQVYFPKRVTEREIDDSEDLSVKWPDEDVEAVKSVFKLLGNVVSNASSPLQVIVLDHADEDVWGNLPGVEVRQIWRNGEKLVPLEWLTED